MSEYVLELKGITKIFPGVKALNNVQFQLKPGEVHALMGENGAGKSTFIKVITGVHKAEEGEMYLFGEKVDFKGPKDAQEAGIAAVYQHPTSYPHLTVAENIFMGHEIKKNHMIQWKAMNEEANKLLKQLNADFDSTAEMGTLSVAQQQMVEIAKALSTNAKIVILDEPTASLTKRESEELYRIVDQLKEKGVSIIFISHRFEDMYRLASRVTVFRDSQYIGTYDVDGITNADLIKAMVGREIKDLFPKPEVKIGDEMLRIEHLSRTGYFKDVSFNVRAGEIVGLTGLVGAGRTEVVESVCGITNPDEGKVYLEGKEVHIKQPSDAMKEGIILLPDDRQKECLIMSWGLGRNVTLPTISKYAKNGFNDEKTERDLSKRLLEEVDTKAVFQCLACLCIFFLRKIPSDDGSQSIGKSHPRDEHEVEEVVDKRGGSQLGRTVMPDHDVVGKAYNNNAQLSQHDRDTQAYRFFVMFLVNRKLHHSKTSTDLITTFSVGRSCLFVFTCWIASTMSRPSTTSP